MNTNTAFILAAGLGTRMGEIGKRLPKPLWPFFDKKLIDIPIESLKKIGFKNLYLNIHHQNEKVSHYLNFRNIKILSEEEILGQGGGVHNFLNVSLKKNKFKNALVINSDQILLPIENFIKKCDVEFTNIFCIKAPEKKCYNSVIFNSQKNLLDIEKNSGEPYTYSGCSLINVDKVLSLENDFKYFTSVANYKKQIIKCVTDSNAQFVDFGTIEKYYHGIVNILKTKNEFLLNWLNSHKLLDIKYIDQKNCSYKSNFSNVINFTNKNVVANCQLPTIFFDIPKLDSIEFHGGVFGEGIYWRLNENI